VIGAMGIGAGGGLAGDLPLIIALRSSLRSLTQWA